MILSIYTGIIRFCFSGIKWYALFSAKAEKWINGRKKQRNSLAVLELEKSFWFHCASLGEYEDCRTIIARIKMKFPDVPIVLTFFSPSGYENVSGKDLADYIFYLPEDTPDEVCFFLNCIHPREAFFCRNDIWPNYLHELQRRKIPVRLLAFNMVGNSAFTRWPQSILYKKCFALFESIYVQNESTAESLRKSFAVNRIIVSGNSRTDRIRQRFSEQKRDAIVARFVSAEFCMILGSGLKKDMEIVAECIRTFPNNRIKWILVPHEIQIGEREVFTTQCKRRVILYSQVTTNDRLENETVLWVDRVGILADLYWYAQLAFLGGGFNRMGIHNILEPAIHGCAVVFGPNHRQYPEALSMLDLGGAEQIRNSKDLLEIVSRFTGNKDLIESVGRINREYISAQASATERTIDSLTSQDKIAG